MTALYRIAFVAIFMLGALSASAYALESTEAGNRAAVEKSFAAWRAGTGSPFDLLAKDAVWTIEGFSSTAGSYTPAELKKLIAPFNAALAKSLVPTVPRVYADGDVVIARFKASAPLKSGGIYTNTYAWFLRFQEGKIVKIHAFLDLPAFEKVNGS